jgi:UDP:flavonoid glycosyltransferase YjiC (YdhE family)
MKRILFVSEYVTLAQVVRLVTLSRALDRDRYELHFACSQFDDLVFRPGELRRWPLYTIERGRVDRALASGKRLYERSDLDAYVRADLAVMDQVRPELVVGDFRPSLAVSCPLSGVPFANLINAYWSPYAVRAGFPLPEHPIVELLGVELAARYFPRAIPAVFAHFAKPMNALRKRHGLPPLGSLPEVLTHGDFTLYPDIPELIPTRELPATHRFLGHVPWSPELGLPLPDPRQQCDPRPLVYVTLGSSGRWDLAPLVLQVLASLPVRVLLSTAGRPPPSPLPANVQARPFVPGDQAARRARLVISNGGASTAYQALAEGRPVIGIAYNLDQYLAMTAIEATGAGTLLRSGTLTQAGLRAAVMRALGAPAHAEHAARLGRAFARYDAAARFRAFVDEVTSARAPAGSDRRPHGPAATAGR